MFPLIHILFLYFPHYGFHSNEQIPSNAATPRIHHQYNIPPNVTAPAQVEKVPLSEVARAQTKPGDSRERVKKDPDKEKN